METVHTPQVLILACGALATEIRDITRLHRLGLAFERVTTTFGDLEPAIVTISTRPAAAEKEHV